MTEIDVRSESEILRDKRRAGVVLSIALLIMAGGLALPALLAPGGAGYAFVAGVLAAAALLLPVAISERSERQRKSEQDRELLHKAWREVKNLRGRLHQVRQALPGVLFLLALLGFGQAAQAQVCRVGQSVQSRSTSYAGHKQASAAHYSQAAVAHHAYAHGQKYEVGAYLQAEAEYEYIASRVLEKLEAKRLTRENEDLRSELLNLRGGGSSGAAAEEKTALPPASAASAFRRLCASCHGAQLTSPKAGMYFDDDKDIDCDTMLAASAVIHGDVDPPGAMAKLIASLTDEDKADLRRQLKAQTK